MSLRLGSALKTRVKVVSCITVLCLRLSGAMREFTIRTGSIRVPEEEHRYVTENQRRPARGSAFIASSLCGSSAASNATQQYIKHFLSSASLFTEHLQ